MPPFPVPEDAPAPPMPAPLFVVAEYATADVEEFDDGPVNGAPAEDVAIATPLLNVAPVAEPSAEVPAPVADAKDANEDVLPAVVIVVPPAPPAPTVIV